MEMEVASWGLAQLSIPWKGGSIDISKVDTRIHFDPVKLLLQPCIIQRMIYLVSYVHIVLLSPRLRDNQHILRSIIRERLHTYEDAVKISNNAFLG